MEHLKDISTMRVIYRPKSDEEARRRVERAELLVGTPFIPLPGNPPQHRVLFMASGGEKIRVEHVEMVWNDALLMDAISNWGEDGPLYKDTFAEDDRLTPEIYEYAERAYGGVDPPPQLRRKP